MIEQIVVGEIAGAFGIKGWVKIYSHTDPPSNILRYSPWILSNLQGSKGYKVLTGSLHSTFVVAQLEGVSDRDAALKLKSSKISVPRDRFPPLGAGEYYWADLIGLTVTNIEGVEFGGVVEIKSTGANDVIVTSAERERLIPFVMGDYVKEINLDEGKMVVDWDADF